MCRAGDLKPGLIGRLFKGPGVQQQRGNDAITVKLSAHDFQVQELGLQLGLGRVRLVGCCRYAGNLKHHGTVGIVDPDFRGTLLPLQAHAEPALQVIVTSRIGTSHLPQELGSPTRLIGPVSLCFDEHVIGTRDRAHGSNCGVEKLRDAVGPCLMDWTHGKAPEERAKLLNGHTSRLTGRHELGALGHDPGGGIATLTPEQRPKPLRFQHGIGTRPEFVSALRRRLHTEQRHYPFACARHRLPHDGAIAGDDVRRGDQRLLDDSVDDSHSSGPLTVEMRRVNCSPSAGRRRMMPRTIVSASERTASSEGVPVRQACI